jgi:hypothetical protein
MREVWVNIQGFPNYQVSNYGSVRSLRTNSLLSHRYNGGGYAHVTLSTYGEQQEYYVHQLVAQAFFDNYKPGMRLKHVNGDQTDCSVMNLQFIRRVEVPRYERSETHSVWGRSVRIVETGEVFRTVRQCARFIGGDYSAIYGVLRGHRSVHLGYTFEYVEGEN